MTSSYFTTLLLLWHQTAVALDNGVALTPPMGFIHWERFECNIDCDLDPDNCISERLFHEIADHMAKDGWLAAGYDIVAMDDCWLETERDANDHLQADVHRFPSGMKALADYMHERGLKLGVYEDVGTKTCAGFPGSEGHMETDAQTFADWGVDFLKFDGCNADIPQFHKGFPEMQRALNATGRHIVYSCEWPMYEKAHGGTPNQTLIAETCNVFRQLTDIYDSWGSVIGMIDYFGDDPQNISQIAGPGAWNDPDQVVIGNYGLSHDQERVQMALYAMLASPMFMSVDLRHIRNSSKQILLNKGVIAINQDPMGIQGRRIKSFSSKISIWTRQVVPRGSLAVAFLYTQDGGYPLKVTTLFSDLGLAPATTYDVTEVFANQRLGQFKGNETFTCRVNPTGVYLIKATPVTATGTKTGFRPVVHNYVSKYDKL